MYQHLRDPKKSGVYRVYVSTSSTVECVRSPLSVFSGLFSDERGRFLLFSPLYCSVFWQVLLVREGRFVKCLLAGVTVGPGAPTRPRVRRWERPDITPRGCGGGPPRCLPTLPTVRVEGTVDHYSHGVVGRTRAKGTPQTPLRCEGGDWTSVLRWLIRTTVAYGTPLRFREDGDVWSHHINLRVTPGSWGWVWVVITPSRLRLTLGSELREDPHYSTVGWGRG